MTLESTVALQALGWTGYVLLTGVLTFWLVVWPHGSNDRRLVALAVTGTGLLVVATLGDPLVRLGSGERLADVLEPQAASALLVRLAGVSAAVFFLPDLLRRPLVGHRRAAAGLLVVLLTTGVLADSVLADSALAGSGSGWASVGLLAGITHALSAAAWVGGVTALAVLLLRRDVPDDLDPMLETFATLATGCLVALLLSGFVRAVVVTEGEVGLLASSFGLAVLLKAGLLALMVLLGRRVRTQPRDTSALRRIVLGEVALATAALLATTALVATAPG